MAKKKKNLKEVGHNQNAERANDKEIWGILEAPAEEEEDDDEEEEENVTEQDRAVKLFDFDAQGQKRKLTAYRADFGDDEYTSTDTTTTSGSSTTTSDTDSSAESYEFDDEDFAELQKLRRNNRPGAPMDPMSRLRMWESSFFINSFMNLENKQQYFFYTVTFGHVNRSRRIQGTLRRRTLYTPGYLLRPGEFKPLSAPLVIWPFKVFLLPYNQLKTFCVTIEMWRINELSFNTLYASAKLTLQDIVDSEQEFQILLKRKIPGKKKSYEVHKLRVSLMLTEVFDIDLSFDSWWFLPDKAMPQKIREVPKQLLFSVPIRGRSGDRNRRKTEVSTMNFWPNAGLFRYRGSLQSITNNYITVTLLYSRPKEWYRPPAHLGLCIMALKSVLQYPLFRGIVKKLTTDPRKFQQGELVGNIRCFIRSVGVHEYEEIPHRPAQPLAGAALVTQLNLREQYLVVRLFKCENLPAANADSYTSDPIVKIKWDAMVNTSNKRENTLRPVYNQNFYFPVRLLDPRERTNPILRQTALPLDLYTKGPIQFEVWDNDEFTSDFLGGSEVHLNSIWREGQWEERCLAEGMGQDDDKTRLPDGRPAEFATKRHADEEEEDEDDEDADEPLIDENIQRATVPYEWPYRTLVLRKILQLKGSALPASTQGTSTLWFEMFFIPPMPDNVELPDPPQVQSSNDVWMQVTKKWTGDFSKYQKMYREWFPQAPGDRRFLCTAEHMQTRGIFPLPSFVAPIAVPSQISAEGELLHWINNITFVSPPKQMRDGKIARWQVPSTILTTRKGGVNDHAVLLCCCLLGLDYDAYVCKGTTNNGQDEHVWVMTRHAGGWVMMWEVTTKKRYNLPYRWGYPSKGPPKGFAAKYEQQINENAEKFWEGMYLQEWYEWSLHQGQLAQAEAIANANAVPDVELYGDEFVSDEVVDPEMVLMEETENFDEERAYGAIGAVKSKVDKDKVLKVLRTQIEQLPITPMKALVNPHETLSFLPYSTVEVVFNNFQLWGNLQNHHPACITYDLEDEWKWRPLLMEPADPVDSDVLLAPPIRDKKCQVLAEDLASSVLEHIRLHRMKKGLEVFFEHREELLFRLTFYLDLLEYRMHLDDLHNPGPGPNHMGWSSFQNESENAEMLQESDCQFYQTISRQTTLTSEEKAMPETQEAMHMHREYGGDAYCMFADVPPPGGFFDPFETPQDSPHPGALQEAQTANGWTMQLVPHQNPPQPELAMNPLEGFEQEIRYQDKMAKLERKAEDKLVDSYAQQKAGIGSWLPGKNNRMDPYSPAGLKFSAAQAHMALPPSSPRSASLPTAYATAAQPPRASAGTSVSCASSISSGAGAAPPRKTVTFAEGVPPETSKRPPVRRQALLLRRLSARLQAAIVEGEALMRSEEAALRAALSAEKRPEGEPARKPERERTTLRRPLETSASAAPAAPCQEGGENEAQRMFARLRTLRPATEKRESSASPPQGLQAASAASRPPASQAPSSASPAAQRGAAAGGRELLSDAPSSSAPPRDAPARASAACGSTAAPERETPFSVNASAVTFLALLRRMSTAMRQLESDLLRRACDGDAARGESAGDDGEGGRVEERRRRGSPSAEEKPGRRLSGGARGRREAARGAETRKGSETTSRGKREMRLNDSRPSHESAHDACLSREKREQEACEKKTGVEQRLRYKEEMRRKVHARLEALAVERSQREAEEAKREAHSLLQEAEEEGRKRALGEPRDDGRPFLQQALVSAELWPAPQSSAPEADLEGRVASAETGEERHATDGEKRGEGELEGEVEDAKDSEKNGNGEEGESDSYSSQSQVSEAYVSLWSGSDSGSDGWASPVPEPEAPEEEDEEMLAGDPFFFSSRSREGRAANQGAPRGSEGAGDAGSRLRQRRQPHARDEGAARPHAGGEESTGSPTHASSSSATFRCVTGRAWLSNLLRKPKNQKEEGSRGTQESRAAAVPALSEQPGARSPPGATSHRSERGERVAQDGDERRQEAGEKAPQRARPDVAGRGDFSAISVPCESAGGRASSPPSSSVSPASSDLSSDTDTLGGSLPPSDVELNQFEAPRGQHYVWDESDESDSEREDAPTEERAAPDGDSKQDARELRRRGARSEPWQIFVPPAACADTPREQLRQARERRKQRRAEKRRENLRAEEAKRAQELEALLLAERQETAEDAQAQPKGGAETEPCESAKEPAKGAEGENGSGKRHSPSTVLADIQKMIASSSQRRTSRAPSSAAAAPSPGVTAQPATAAFLAEDRAAYSRSSSSGAKASEDTGLGNDAHASGSSQARLPLAAPASASARMREIYRQCRQKASRSQCFSSSSASLLSMPSLPSLSASSLAVKKMTGVFLQAQKRKARRSGQEACVTNSDADDSWGVAEVSEGVEEEAGRRAGNKGLEFYEAAEHSMMYDLDYDDMPKQNFGGATAWGYNQTAAPPPPTTAEMNMKAPEGMRWDPFSQTYQYTYRNPYVDEAYGDPYAGAVQQQGEVAQVELNAGRLADYRIGKGAYRVNQQTGAHDLIDGPQKDLYGKYGAMDHIDQKKDKRPKGPRPTEWDLQYAKNLYEQGVPAGYTPAPNEEDQEALVRDLLRAPTQGAEEYAAYDGGVDIAALGLATERPADKKVRVAKPQAADAEDEEERLEQPASPPAAEPRAGAGAYAKKTEEEPVVPPIEWHRPSPTGHYAADQVAKWKWYYRMEEIYYIWQQMDFPVRNNHVFCGFPVHFSSSDVNDIRSYLGGARRFRKLLDIPVDSIVYAITAKCFPLMGGVISTWLFFGAEVPLISTQERERRMKRTKKPKHVKRPED